MACNIFLWLKTFAATIQESTFFILLLLLLVDGGIASLAVGFKCRLISFFINININIVI